MQKMLVVKGSNFAHTMKTFCDKLLQIKSEDQRAQNWYLMFLTVLTSLTFCFGFVSFVFILDIFFLQKKLVLINLNWIIQLSRLHLGGRCVH